MKDYLNIGASPPNEDCVQVGTENYETLGREECRRYIKLLHKKMGLEPEGARLAIKSFPHDFGNYLEVVCFYDEDKPDSVDYAFRCESDGPQNWEEI